MEIDVSRFRAAFYVEAAEHLEAMEAALLQLDAAPRDTELLNTIFRAAHSIKGASTTFGISEVGRFTHVLESLLERLRDGLLESNAELVGLLLSSVDVINALIANAKDGSELPENLDEVLEQLQHANGQSELSFAHHARPTDAVADTSTNSYRVRIKPGREFFRYGQDPLLLLRELWEIAQIQRVVVDDSQVKS